MKKTVLVGLLVSASVLFAGCGAKTYSLNDYIEYDVNGIDGYATLGWGFDSDALAESIMDADQKNYATEESKIRLYFDLEDYDWGAWDKLSDISNGDTIHFDWNDSEISRFNESHKKIKVKAEQISYSVEGLEEIGQIDVFEGIEINVSGIDPKGELTIKQGKYSDLWFKADIAKDLKNGDVVTITASAPYALETYCIDRYQAVPISDTMQYTVEGLDSYMTSVSQLDENSIKLMKDNILSERREETSNKYKGYVKESYEDLGYILLVRKDTENSWGDVNILYNVVKIDDVYDFMSNKGVQFTRYLYYAYDDCIVYKDGTVFVDAKNYKTTSSYSNAVKVGGYFFAGYETYDALYNDLVVGNMTKYTSDVRLNENPESIEVEIIK